MQSKLNPSPQHLILLRDRLIEKKIAGLLGVVAARANVPEYVLRDWVDNGAKVPSQKEVELVQNCLDNKHRSSNEVL